MSDHEMQSFSDDKRDSFPSQDWSPEHHSVSPEPVPIARADQQSLDQVWGRLEEHVSRNSSYYQHNRNLPALYMQNSSREKLQYERPAHFLRSLSWRRLDTIAAILFLTLLMGSLLTVVYYVQQTTQLGSSGTNQFPESVICEKVKIQTQVVTIVEGRKGIELQPHQIVVRQGTQIIWVNQTNGNQIVINANTKIVAMKVALGEKIAAEPLTRAETYAYYVQQLPLQKESSHFSENASVIVQVVNLVMIVPTANEAVFQPMKIVLPQGGALVWLNATQDKQVVVDLDVKQDPLVLSPNACHVQRGISSGNHLYQLKGNGSSQLFLNAS